jgi:hypothetical protein
MKIGKLFVLQMMLTVIWIYTFFSIVAKEKDNRMLILLIVGAIIYTFIITISLVLGIKASAFFEKRPVFIPLTLLPFFYFLLDFYTFIYVGGLATITIFSLLLCSEGVDSKKLN